jgi:AcrR family transcriptional regulator
MARRASPLIHSRKQPQQTRSEELVSAILEAAIQVLAKEGFHRFTTARVADKAGVSVGSLYQYFPNKASILFRLQSDEWRDTNEMLRQILEDESTLPSMRLRKLVHAFIKAKAAGRKTFVDFMERALPETTEEKRSLVVDVIISTLSGVGKDFSTRPRTVTEIATFSNGLADMLCSYLESFEK